jgi:hypothetical protein
MWAQNILKTVKCKRVVSAVQQLRLPQVKDADHFMLDLWWTECHWDRMFLEHLGFPLSLSCRQCPILLFVTAHGRPSCKSGVWERQEENGLSLFVPDGLMASQRASLCETGLRCSLQLE